MPPRSRGSTPPPDRLREEPVAPSSAPASRQRRGRWRDPRLWLGVVLVLGSVVLGAKVLSSADDTIAVWQVVHDVPAGTPVGSSDLRVTRVRFSEPSVAGQYVAANEPIGAGAHATRDLHAGEMLASASISSAASPLTRQLPLGVAAAHQPADLRAGDHVDVWAVPAASNNPGAGAASPVLVLHDVTVLSVGESLSGLSGERQVLLGLGADVDVGPVLRLTTGAQVVLVRLAG